MSFESVMLAPNCAGNGSPLKNWASALSCIMASGLWHKIATSTSWSALYHEQHGSPKHKMQQVPTQYPVPSERTHMHEGTSCETANSWPDLRVLSNMAEALTAESPLLQLPPIDLGLACRPGRETHIISPYISCR